MDCDTAESIEVGIMLYVVSHKESIGNIAEDLMRLYSETIVKRKGKVKGSDILWALVSLSTDFIAALHDEDAESNLIVEAYVNIIKTMIIGKLDHAKKLKKEDLQETADTLH